MRKVSTSLGSYLVVLGLRGELVRPALLLHAEEAHVERGVLEQQVRLERAQAGRAVAALRHRAQRGMGDRQGGGGGHAGLARDGGEEGKTR